MYLLTQSANLRLAAYFVLISEVCMKNIHNQISWAPLVVVVVYQSYFVGRSLRIFELLLLLSD
jgi:hypothetical protein